MKKQTKEDNNLDNCTCVAEKEFNLSEKIQTLYLGFGDLEVDVIHTEDVKEFIRRLKSVFGNDKDLWDKDAIYDEINRLAGDKLTK